MNLNDFYHPAEEKEVVVKALLTSPSGGGKTSSVILGAPRPLLVFDLEDGSQQFSKAKGFEVFENKNDPNFDPTDPNNILWFTSQLKMAKQSGFALPFKSILLDSGTVLYNRIINDHLKKLKETEPNKKRLEPNEYAEPKSKFYEIISNLKSLGIHIFITAHAADNYLKSSFMQINISDPIKPDCEKRLIHEMDVHYMLSKTGNKYKASLKKSRIVDSQMRNLLPEVIDNFDNFTLIPMILEAANKDQGYERKKDETVPQNSIRTDAKADQTIDNIIELVGALGMTNEQAVTLLQEQVGKNNPYELNQEEATKVYSYLKTALNESGGSQGE